MNINIDDALRSRRIRTRPGQRFSPVNESCALLCCRLRPLSKVSNIRWHPRCSADELTPAGKPQPSPPLSERRKRELKMTRRSCPQDGPCIPLTSAKNRKVLKSNQLLRSGAVTSRGALTTSRCDAFLQCGSPTFAIRSKSRRRIEPHDSVTEGSTAPGSIVATSRVVVRDRSHWKRRVRH